MNAMLLETKDLCKYYGSGENLVKAIDHTTMTIQRGDSLPLWAVPVRGRVRCSICSVPWTARIKAVYG